jgi:hypothetical protein
VESRWQVSGGGRLDTGIRYNEEGIGKQNILEKLFYSFFLILHSGQ